MDLDPPRSSERLARLPTLRQGALLLGCAWLVPFLVHLFPWRGAVPLGAHVLPMFWTALVAVYFHGAPTGLVVALFAPLLNLLVTGLPPPRFVLLLSLELTVFVCAVAAAVHLFRRVWIVAPLAYLVALGASTAWQAWMQVLPVDLGWAEAWAGTALQALPGLAILAAINFALTGFFRPDDEADDL